MADKQLFELQNKLTESNRSLTQTIQLINYQKAEQKRGILTAEELAAIQDNTPSFKSVGRMFFGGASAVFTDPTEWNVGTSRRTSEVTRSKERLLKETSKTGRRESKRTCATVVH